MSWAQHNKALQETITFMDKGKLISYLDLESTLEEFKEWKPLFTHKFLKWLKKMLLNQKANLAHYKQKPWKKIRMHIMTSECELQAARIV